MRRRAWLQGASALVGSIGSVGSVGCRTRSQPSNPPASLAPAVASPPAVDTTREPASPRFETLRGLADGVPPVDVPEYESRRTAVQARMRAAGAQWLVIEPGPNLTYLAPVRWGRSERPFLLVLPAEGSPRWLVPAFEVRTAREQIADGEEIVPWAEDADPFRTLAGVFGGRKPSVVVDPGNRAWVFERLHAVAGKGVRISALVEDVRLVKTERELARLRRANEVTKVALAEAARAVEVGMRQSEIAALVRDAQLAAGLSDVWCLALVGPAASFPHGTAEDRVLADGELVLVDTGGALHGYRSDITRTWAPGGRASADVRKAWDTVMRAQATAMARIAPGTRCGDVDAAARRIIEAEGFGADYSRFTHRLGHGIGLEVHEAPYLVRDADRALASGMTMSNEPGIYVPDAFGIRVEDIVAVTSSGHERFGPGIGGWDDPFAGHDPASITR